MGAERLVDNRAVSTAAATLTRNQTVVCAYHGVEDPDSFEQHLRWLLASRKPLDLATFEQMVLFGRAPDEPSFFITFDDGRRSVYERGLPVLQRLGVPAALFVITDLIDGSEPFWWDEVEQLSDAGGRTSVVDASGVQLVRELKRVPDHERRRAISELRNSASRPAAPYAHLTADEVRELHLGGVAIASHSATHPCLDQCTSDDILDELTRSRRTLEEILDEPVRSVAYPNGNVDDRVVDLARRAGYTVGFAFDHKLTAMPTDGTMLVSRVRVDTRDEPSYFSSVCSGVRPAIHHLRGLP
jgi:peptidoglycan/xylan/chitin deacetylase (PgdA/CDA1 family)